MTGSDVRIGVATTVIPRKRIVAGRTFVRPSLFYCRLAQEAADAGTEVIIFAPDNVDFVQGRVSGYTPVHPKQAFADWHKVTVRVPNVIYENVFVHLAVQGKAATLRREARRRGIPLFNPPFPSKWQFHRLLQGHASLNKYLPKTQIYQSASDTLKRVDDWGTVYVKPVGGYGGLGVTRIEPLGNGQYRISADRSGTKTGKFRRTLSRTALIELLQHRVQRLHVVQQEIPLLKLQKRKVDFRVVTQRGDDGQWQVTGTVPKIAAQDGVVTNIIAGGERLTLDACKRLALQEGKVLRIEALEKLALDLSRFATQRIPNVGIIGYDLGLDGNGRPWLIEANPKPARSLLDSAMINQSARQCARFAIYLATHRTGPKRR